MSRKPKRRKKKRGDLHNIVLSIGKGYKPRIMTLANMLQMIDEVRWRGACPRIRPVQRKCH